MDFKEFITGNKGKDIPKELKEFNWGAFLLTFIWGFKHKAWITLIAIPLLVFEMPYMLNLLLFGIFQLYCGFKGNEWAYQVDWWKTPADFRKTQIKWAIVAVAINILTPIILGGIITRFITKSQDNPVQFLRNTQCVTAYKHLKKELPRTVILPSSTSIDIANSFNSNLKNTEIENSTIIFMDKNKNKKYYIDFSKEADKSCSILEKNCLVTSQYVLPAEILTFDNCYFFIDNSKNIVPHENTQDAIKKGSNIFKYL